jgi:hypothetical protein
MFATFLHHLPIVVATLVCLFVLVGFWRGLSLRPHQPEHRPSPHPPWFWWLSR